ncbi:ribbon-helix-helix protein, CopG family [Allomesorhizobium camelthorni]|uniref:Ribbon-helix-helix protein, CopG family n=1 Tax=Allomesorhizobium camelthorni TaxID=475069 RepID=A0A6G4W7W0_9HYPH|nr:ribbon-helix-helix protein, CopG family [Mesorhizobium camelthorni]NGO50240.1 ribbon-helix-helix protein, CopG family [Mesorhizobium camelthorni]
MKNITVTVDNETYRRARMKAAERDSSVSAMVREYLKDLANTETEFERLKRKEAAIRSTITGFSASDRLSREEVHERNR